MVGVEVEVVEVVEGMRQADFFFFFPLSPCWSSASPAPPPPLVDGSAGGGSGGCVGSSPRGRAGGSLSPRGGGASLAIESLGTRTLLRPLHFFHRGACRKIAAGPRRRARGPRAQHLPRRRPSQWPTATWRRGSRTSSTPSSVRERLGERDGEGERRERRRGAASTAGGRLPPTLRPPCLHAGALACAHEARAVR